MNLPEKNNFLSRIGIIHLKEDGITKWLKSIITFSAFIAILVFVDYFLPAKKSMHQVKSLVVRNGFEEIHYEIYLRLNEKIGEEEFWIIFDAEEWAANENTLAELKIGDKIELSKTMLFGINIQGENKSNHSKIFYPYINVYGFFIFFPIVFLLLFGLMIYYKTQTEAIMTIGVITIISLLGFGFLLLFY